VVVAGMVVVVVVTGRVVVVVAGTAVVVVVPGVVVVVDSARVVVVVTGMVVLARRSGGRRCSLCNRRLGEVALDCPRCRMVVCDQGCWVFEHCRCRLCEDNRVPVLPPDGRWWDQRFGLRMRQGRCLLCLAEAADADLRACGHCGRAQCRPCWDAGNGQCSRCKWIVEGLPEALRVYMSGN